jgi:hypothetical protein
MMITSTIALAVAGLAQVCLGQQAGWKTGQVNTTMCQWQNPRGRILFCGCRWISGLEADRPYIAAVIRDTLYIDGGNLLWEPGMSDGTYGSPISDGTFFKSIIDGVWLIAHTFQETRSVWSIY